MKNVELTNQELKDIYGGLGSVATEEMCHIYELRNSEDKEDKEICRSLEERHKRYMDLINKVGKLIDWNE